MENILDNYGIFKDYSSLIIKKANELSEKETFYFVNGDKYLSDYVNSLKELRKTITDYNNLFYEFEMELEQAEYEQWEKEQEKIEKEYYSEVI